MLGLISMFALLEPARMADPVTLPLSMLIVFGSAKLLAAVFERMGQPGIIGQILAGVLFGPPVLGWIHPNSVVHALADLGVIFLLFRVGLEVRSSELFRVGPTAFVVALLGVIVPFFAGWLILFLFGRPTIEAVFVGTAMVATSVGITAQVLASKGLLEHRASKIILAAAVIDDVLGLLALAVVTSLAEGRIRWSALALTAAMAVAFTLLVATLGTRAAKHVVPHIAKRFHAGEIQFDIALVVLFALSVLAVKVGVAAIIGAFLGGMALAETVSHRVHDLAHGITEFLLPFFLFGIGMNLNPEALTHRETLWLAALIVIAAALSKLVGSGLGAIRLGWTDTLRVGIGMIPRGEVGMVVAQIGLTLHVVEKSIYAVVVFMAVATTMIAPPLLNIAYRKAVPVAGEAEEFSIG
jgi:Kef-type K+ transport system membrane component KefB